jgi:hypothetical protein
VDGKARPGAVRPVLACEVVLVFLGIDPGVGGGIACLDEAGGVVFAVAMPESDHDLFAYLDGRVGRAVLEKVHSSPQMGVASSFTFGVQFGRCRMALAAAAIPFDLVSPQKWQRLLNCFSEGDKAVTKIRAAQLFPGLKVTHAIADCLLLAEYCRRTQRLTDAVVG